ncbi:MAG: DUF1508 domain-containing protein [Fimbriimonadales bacterium]
MKYVLYMDHFRQYRWYLEAANGRKIANGGEGYHNKMDCVNAIHLVMGSGIAPIRDATQR